jgi:uncharacterized protein with ParB-like and HNH nuclease domain
LPLINPSTFLEPASLRVLNLFTGGGNFLIPEYQRDYSWSREQAKDLWEDILALTKSAFTSDGNHIPSAHPHFLGAIVVQAFPLNEGRDQEVMDGQQRLVTLSIFFSVLHEFTQTLQRSEDRAVWGESIKNMLFTYVGGEKVPKLKLARDNDYFRELILNRLDQNSRLDYLSTLRFNKNSVLYRLKECAEFFYTELTSYLSSVSGDVRDKRLINLIKSLTELTIVLQMKVMEQGAAYEVFESLNARGLELQQADLLKNKLFSLAKAQNSYEEVVQCWNTVVKSVEQQSMLTLTEFFFFHLISKHKECKQSNLYKEVLLLLQSPGATAENYARDVARSAEHLQQILDAGALFDANVARDISSIKDLLSNKYALTLLIAGASKYPLQSPEMAQIIKLANHFVFRRFLVQEASLAAYTQEISKASRDLSQGVINGVEELKIRLQSYSSDADFIDSFANYSVPSNKIGFYILEMIENHLSQNAGTYVHRQSISQHLEHIMPRKPGNNDWTHVSNLPNYQEHVSKVGNFLILEADINSFIRNKSFDHKNSNPQMRDYQHSRLALPRTISNYLEGGEWTFESITRRQRDIADQFSADVWSLQ